MNDIWYLEQGVWMVYVDELQVAEDFKSISTMQFITDYYDNRGRQLAAQFRFYQGDDLRPGFCLLHYVSRLAGFDYYKVLDLAKHLPGSTYRQFYRQRSYQPELFEILDGYEPDRKYSGKKCRSK